MRMLLVLAGVVGALGAAEVENTVCVCGKPVNAKVPAARVVVGDHVHLFGACSEEDRAKIKALIPEEAVKAIEAKNPKR